VGKDGGSPKLHPITDKTSNVANKQTNKNRQQATSKLLHDPKYIIN
jgi:hypothetical protein